MAYSIAVQVQFPRLAYVPLLVLGRSASSRRALVPIRGDQRTAVVRLFLMRGAADGTGLVPVRELHAFRVTGFDPGVERRPRLALSAHFDGRRTVAARLEVEGDGVQAARIRVPLSRRARRFRFLLLLIFLLFLAAGVFFFARWSMFQTVSDVAREVDATSPIRPVDPSDDAQREVDQIGPAELGDGAEEQPEPETGVATRADGADGAGGGEAGGRSVSGSGAAGESGQTTSRSGQGLDAADTAGTDQEQSPPSITLPALPLTRVIYFDPNRTYLTGAAREVLDELVPVLLSYPSLRISLDGHTALFGTEQGRTEISRGRAEGVQAYLEDRGWAPETPPEVSWSGSSEPVTRDRVQQHLNRRVEILVTGGE